MTVERPIREQALTELLRRSSIARERFCHRLLVLASGLLLFALGSFAADNLPSEYQVKGAFLLNFTKFIDWPAAAFESPDSPFSLCILGDDPFGSALDQLVEGETVNGRRVAIQRLRRAPRPKSCQVLFLDRSENDARAIVSGLGPGVLTVSDRDAFLRDGGMIEFILDGRHVRFDINLRAAASASLTMNARLLKVARSVQR